MRSRSSRPLTIPSGCPPPATVPASSSQERVIGVRKEGLERFVFNLSREQPLIYGLVSLVLAALAGWGASAAFRLIRV